MTNEQLNIAKELTLAIIEKLSHKRANASATKEEVMENNIHVADQVSAVYKRISEAVKEAAQS